MLVTPKKSLREAILKQLEESYTNDAFPTDASSFEALSTIRFDPALAPASKDSEINPELFFLLHEHHTRLLFTLRYFKLHISESDELDFDITFDFMYESIREALIKSGRPLTEASKIRLMVKLDGSMNIEVHDTPPRANLLDGLLDDYEDIWDVYLDKESTLISPFTSFKTTTRGVYSEARERTLPDIRPGREEAILFNGQSMVMEGSITNIAIPRPSDNKWITPQLSAGCICGVMRHFLLRKKYVEEQQISRADIPIGTKVLLFNGLMGVVQGRVVG